MSNYDTVMEKQNYLVNLGKELNIKETIKKNKEKYLDIILSDIDENDYLDFEDQINLIESYESNYEKIKKFYSMKHKNKQNDSLFIRPDINDDRIILMAFAIYLLKLKIIDFNKEIELIKQSNEDLNEQYSCAIEELDEKDQEIDKACKNNYNLKMYFSMFFLTYNYLIYFSFEEIVYHFTLVTSLIYYTLYYMLFKYSLNMFVIILLIAGVGYIYERLLKYKND